MRFPATGGTVFDDLDDDRPWHDPAIEADKLQERETAWATRLPLLSELLRERFGSLLELATEVPGWLPTEITHGGHRKKRAARHHASTTHRHQGANSC